MRTPEPLDEHHAAGRSSEREPRPRRARAPERALLAVALLAGGYWRLRDVGPAFLFGDELHTLADMHRGLGGVLSTFSDTGSGMALPLLQLPLVDVFGAGHWAIRAPAWAAGLGLLFLVYPVTRRWVGTRGAVVATLLVAVNPLLIFYSHFARSYALVSLLCLLLLDRLQLALEERPPAARPGRVGLVGLTALLPWVHPTALGFVVPVFAGAILALLREGGRRDEALRLAGALALGGLLCLGLHLPAGSSLADFVATKGGSRYLGDFGFWDVATLLAGGRWAAALGVAGVAMAAAAHLRERRWRGLPLVLGCAGPGLTIAAIAPYGDAYAYARYVMPCIAPACVLLGDGLLRAARGLRRGGASAGPIALAAGAAGALALFLTGPNGPRRTPDGPYANTYLDILPLPAFDRPWPQAPAFYRELAALPDDERSALRIIESPALTTRTRHLYRSYYLLHGVETLLAPFPGEFPRLVDGPYVSLGAGDWRERADADYLIVHLDVMGEALRYWRYVYGDSDSNASGRFGDRRAYMQRHASFGASPNRPPPGLLSRLVADLGQPIRSDDGIRVWRLR